MRSAFSNFHEAIRITQNYIGAYGEDVPVHRWQGVDTGGHFRELLFHEFAVSLATPQYSGHEHLENMLPRLREDIKPNLPWADDHFAERVGGKPLNPGEQYKNWPHWRPESAAIALDKEGKFSHTYMERFWPKQWFGQYQITGLRYPLGDLNDVVQLLLKDPYTRQAYFPIWFPEDTGAVKGQRVPCTIGYYFLMRNHRLHMRYYIRSCDFNRYFRDDIYMAVRLQLWMLEELRQRELLSDHEQLWFDVEPGTFLFDCDSLHVIGGDFHVKQA